MKFVFTRTQHEGRKTRPEVALRPRPVSSSFPSLVTPCSPCLTALGGDLEAGWEGVGGHLGRTHAGPTSVL